MRLLDKLTKYFLNNQIKTQEENQILYQRIADLEKLLEV